jgi:hypothetical protein
MGTPGALRGTRQSIQVLMSTANWLLAPLTIVVSATVEVSTSGALQSATADITSLSAFADRVAIRVCDALAAVSLDSGATEIGVWPRYATDGLTLESQTDKTVSWTRALGAQLDLGIDCYVNLEGYASLDVDAEAVFVATYARDATSALDAGVVPVGQYVANRHGTSSIALSATTEYVGPRAISALAEFSLQASTYICQVYDLNGSASLTLSSTLVASGTQRVEATSAISLECLADHGKFLRSAAIVLNLGATSEATNAHTATCLLNFQATAEQGQARVGATSHLALTSSARTNPRQYGGSTDIVFATHATASIYMLMAGSALDVTADTTAQRPTYVAAGVSLDAVGYAFNPTTQAIEAVPAGLRVTAAVAAVASYATQHYLQFQSESCAVLLRADAISAEAAAPLALEVDAYKTKSGIGVNQLSLGVISAGGACKPATATLELVADVSVSRMHSVGVSVVLDLKMAFCYVVSGAGAGYAVQYHPFIGSGDIGVETPSATLTGPLDGVTVPFQFVYPSEGPASDSITLRAPSLGNKDRLSFNRISRESRGGTLIVYADPIWPRTQTLALTFSALQQAETSTLLGFLNAHVGCEIGMMDWEHRYWRGVIVNPDAPAIEDRFGSYTINLEFEGELDTEL